MLSMSLVGGCNHISVSADFFFGKLGGAMVDHPSHGWLGAMPQESRVLRPLHHMFIFHFNFSVCFQFVSLYGVDANYSHIIIINIIIIIHLQSTLVTLSCYVAL